MKRFICKLGLVSLFIVSLSTIGAADPGNIAMGLNIGTLGAGIDLTVGITSNLNVRGGINALDLNSDGDESDVEYDFNIDLLSYPLFLDWYPIDKVGFRISAGILICQNQLNLDAVSQKEYEIGDETYSAEEIVKLTGRMDFNGMAPYIGIGWGNAVGKNQKWAFACDLGFAFLGEPHFKLKADTNFNNEEEYKEFINELEKEKDELEDDFNDYGYYPVITLGITYKF